MQALPPAQARTGEARQAAARSASSRRQYRSGWRRSPVEKAYRTACLTEGMPVGTGAGAVNFCRNLMSGRRALLWRLDRSGNTWPARWPGNPTEELRDAVDLVVMATLGKL